MTLQQRLADMREQVRSEEREFYDSALFKPALVLALLDVAEAAQDFMTSERDSDEESDAYDRTFEALLALERSLDNG